MLRQTSFWMEKLKLFCNLRIPLLLHRDIKMQFSWFRFVSQKMCNEIMFTVVSRFLVFGSYAIESSRSFCTRLISPPVVSKLPFMSQVHARARGDEKKSILVNLISSSVLMNANCLLFFSDIFASSLEFGTRQRRFIYRAHMKLNERNQ